MESLRERCPVSTVLLHSYFEVPGIWAPFQIPVPHSCTEDPVEGDAHIWSPS
jgi:hypothetical protein